MKQNFKKGLGLVFLLLPLLLQSCGKKGPLYPPPGEPDTSGRAYPSYE